MTNTRTIFGAFAWSTVAATLMLITFAPVKVEQSAPLQISASTAAAPAQAAL
jgi:hypothetical protein